MPGHTILETQYDAGNRRIRFKCYGKTTMPPEPLAKDFLKAARKHDIWYIIPVGWESSDEALRRWAVFDTFDSMDDYRNALLLRGLRG